MGVLYLEFLRDRGARFVAKNLLSCNPAILVNELGPRLDDLERQVIVPGANEQLVKALVPQETLDMKLNAQTHTHGERMDERASRSRAKRAPRTLDQAAEVQS